MIHNRERKIPPRLIRKLIACYKVKSFNKHYYHPEQLSSLEGMDAAVDEWIELYANYGPLEYRFNREGENFSGD